LGLGRLKARLQRFQPSGGSFEQRTTINLVREKLWRLLSHPDSLRHFRNLSVDLGTRVASPDHENRFSFKPRWANVLGGVQLLPLEHRLPWISGYYRSAPVACGTDDRLGIPGTIIREDAQSIIDFST